MKDLDRGISEAFDKDLGISVWMYKDEPGVYYTGDGTPVSDELAKSVGFDVVANRRLKAVKEGQEAAAREIAAITGDQPTVVQRNRGFELIKYRKGVFNVRASNGEVLSPSPVTEDVAKRIFVAAATPDEDQEGEAPRLDDGMTSAQRSRAAREEAKRMIQERRAAQAENRPEA